jgi:hypothetical protein
MLGLKKGSAKKNNSKEPVSSFQPCPAQGYPKYHTSMSTPGEGILSVAGTGMLAQLVDRFGTAA